MAYSNLPANWLKYWKFHLIRKIKREFSGMNMFFRMKLRSKCIKIVFNNSNLNYSKKFELKYTVIHRIMPLFSPNSHIMSEIMHNVVNLIYMISYEVHMYISIQEEYVISLLIMRMNISTIFIVCTFSFI